MSILAGLKPAKGSTHNSKALGRGRGSGKGGRSTKGGKGQKARKGAPIRRGFEGGQTPMARRMPKFGFTNGAFKVRYDIVNLRQLADMSGTIGPEELVKAGLVRSGALIKILGHGELKKSLTLKAHKFSQTALEAITKIGGKAEVI